MRRPKVGEFCLASATGTGLEKFNPKPTRPVFIADILENYAGVFPLSSQSSSDSELVNVFPLEVQAYLIRRAGLYTVPLSHLEPMGYSQPIRASDDKAIKVWRKSCGAWIQAGHESSLPVPLLVPLPEHTGVELELLAEEADEELFSLFERWFHSKPPKPKTTLLRSTTKPLATPELEALRRKMIAEAEIAPPPARVVKPVEPIPDEKLFAKEWHRDGPLAEEKRRLRE
ncbi:MAG: hypothetical protein K8R88_03440 [Armatimonadetes bacterium]|nr:hypothetical protein [Armatimonadota bacterium]